jgi:AcrR family transcriptional regulator
MGFFLRLFESEQCLIRDLSTVKKKSDRRSDGARATVSVAMAKVKKAKVVHAYHHGDLRRALLEASLSLVREGGVGALSLREAARKAGVSPAAPYHHFKSRTALLAAIAEQGFARMLAAMEAGLAGAGVEPAARLEALGNAYVQFALSHPEHFRVMFLPELSPHGEFPSLDAARRPTFELLIQHVAAMQAAGLSPSADPRGLVFTAWAAVHGIAALVLDGPLGGAAPQLGISLEQLGPLVASTLCKMMSGAASAPR